MEWVETTGKSIEEAKSIALDRLGVADEDAEFEILEEPKPGLFGRVRGEARVRARVKPKSPRAKNDRRDRGRRRDGAPREEGSGDRTGENRAPRQKSQKQEKKMSDNNDRPRRERPDGPPADPAEVAAQAEKFLLGLAGALGASASTQSVIEGDDIEVQLNGSDLGLLVGPRGSTLQAVQDITRVVAQRRMGDHDTRLRIDIGGYRAKRKEALSRFVNQVADEVVSSGTARALEAMPSSDRKIVHDALTGRTDIATHSEGEDPNRRVVITPAGTTEG
ncbi:MAG: KH domain-containing protein [Acidimicrobiia bacterium]|jgi:spoIIIJ-associated protein|nr:KH domain-containing protein [Acidimicrobiia bacterium]NDE60025.1 KH domain-containing protein [Acidimicrobiia bacterium]NDE81153.1 KH domain-containing protein [Actinomycetota bacterium]NDF31963.1 KH domain-containing protein [Acidimicrobiia bacterium]